MRLLILLFSIGCFLAGLGACEQQKLKIELNGNILKIIIVSDKVKSLFLLTESDDECRLDNRFEGDVNKSITLDINEQREQRLSSVIITNDEIILYDYKIEGGQATEVCSENQKCLPEETDFDIKGCSGRLIFEENFTDTNLNKWTHAVYSTVHTRHEFPAFLKNNCYIEDNKLHINATLSDESIAFKLRDNCTYSGVANHEFICGPYRFTYTTPLPPMHSAKIHTKGNFSFQYGRIEIRAKMPIGDWLFPYLLLQPNNTEVESDNQPHIRIAYVRGNPKLRDYAYNEIGGNVLFGSIFSNKPIREYWNTNKSDSHYGDAFHNYTVIKHRDRIIFKVDGSTYGTITDKMIIDDINKNEHYIVIGLTAGGKMNFRDEYVYSENNFKLSDPKAPLLFLEAISGNLTSWKHPKLVIDHVRVYTTHPNEN